MAIRQGLLSGVRHLRAPFSLTPQLLQEVSLVQQLSRLRSFCWLAHNPQSRKISTCFSSQPVQPPMNAWQRPLPKSSTAWSTCAAQRSLSSLKGPQPRFKGKKIKLRSAYKERFKLKADGTVKMFRPGFRHRRSRKSNTQRLRLKSPITMHQTYANTLKRMGFK